MMKRKLMLKISILSMLLIFTFGIFISNNTCKASEIQNNSIPDDCIYEVDGIYRYSGDVVFKKKANIYDELHQFFQWLKEDDIISIISSDQNIISTNSNGKVVAEDPGVAYLNISIKETENYKSFDVRYYVVVNIPKDSDIGIGQTVDKKKKGEIRHGFYFPALKKNTLEIGNLPGPHKVAKWSKNTTLVYEIASDKKFNKIIKKYKSSSNKTKKKIKNLKKIGIKKNKKFYVRVYAYKKISDKITLYSENSQWADIKMMKNENLKNYHHGYIKMKNPTDKEILMEFGIEDRRNFDLGKFEALYKK